jgi:hypothetical protein
VGETREDVTELYGSFIPKSESPIPAYGGEAGPPPGSLPFAPRSSIALALVIDANGITVTATAVETALASLYRYGLFGALRGRFVP